MSGKEIMEASRAPNVFDMPGSPYLRFDRKYSGVWQALMECVLRANELWYAVDPGGDTFKKGGVEKTKAAAATGLKKVKAGTAQGFQWIKDKYQKKSAGKSGKQGGGSEVAAGY